MRDTTASATTLVCVHARDVCVFMDNQSHRLPTGAPRCCPPYFSHVDIRFGGRAHVLPRIENLLGRDWDSVRFPEIIIGLCEKRDAENMRFQAETQSSSQVLSGPRFTAESGITLYPTKIQGICVIERNGIYKIHKQEGMREQGSAKISHQLLEQDCQINSLLEKRRLNPRPKQAQFYPKVRDTAAAHCIYRTSNPKTLAEKLPSPVSPKSWTIFSTCLPKKFPTFSGDTAAADDW